MQCQCLLEYTTRNDSCVTPVLRQRDLNMPALEQRAARPYPVKSGHIDPMHARNMLKYLPATSAKEWNPSRSHCPKHEGLVVVIVMSKGTLYAV